jgi:phenylalanyl-tRNA synthetase beta chain
LLGTTLDAEDVWDALAPLGIDLDSESDSGFETNSNAGSSSDSDPNSGEAESDGGVLVATPPSFRPDLEREIDLVEEVARRIGFDRIGRTRPDTHGQVGQLSQRQRERRDIADALVGLGCSEAITLSLVSPADLERAGAPLDRIVRATNPLRAEESVLRTGILPGLLRAVAYNRSHGIADVALFEQGRVFLSPVAPAAAGSGGEGDAEVLLPDEPEHVAVVLAGTVRRAPLEADRPVDGYDAVDALQTIADALWIADFDLVADDVTGYRRGRAARVLVSGREIGAVGEVAPEVLAALGLEAPVTAFEVDADRLAQAPRRDQAHRTPSRYPASSIDLAFVVDTTIPASAIERTLRTAGGDELEAVDCFDVFTADSLGAGKRSLAFSLRFRAADRTLTDAEVANRRDAAIAAVAAAHGAVLRGGA